MSLEKKIEEKLNESLKNKDKTVFPTLRLIISAIKDFKIANKVKDGSLKDQEIISILKKMNKQRNDCAKLIKRLDGMIYLKRNKRKSQLLIIFYLHK